MQNRDVGFASFELVRRGGAVGATISESPARQSRVRLGHVHIIAWVINLEAALCYNMWTDRTPNTHPNMARLFDWHAPKAHRRDSAVNEFPPSESFPSFITPHSTFGHR